MHTREVEPQALPIFGQRKTAYFFSTMLISITIIFCTALTGCQNVAKDSLTQSTHTSTQNSQSIADGPMEQCQRELTALSKINPTMYETRRTAFSELLKNASVYSSVRKDINLQTKDTVDALYKYKAQNLCHDIEQDIQRALINHGESLK